MTTFLQSSEILTVHIGDTRPDLTFVVTDEDGVTVRDISDHAAYVVFGNVGATAPHMKRAALVDGPNGLIKYSLRGDEYTQEGIVQIQWTVFPINGNNGAVGRGYYRTSGPIVERRVVA